MKKLPLLLASVTLLFSCNEQPKEKGYTLTGTIKNAPDSTLVIYHNDENNIDSTFVLNEKFRFSGKAEEPHRSFIYLPANGERSYFWIENSAIEYSAEYGNLSEAVITGSQSQNEFIMYWERLDPVDQAFESIRSQLFDKDLSEAKRDSLRTINAALRQERYTITQQFIRDYPNSHASLELLDGYKPAWGKGITKELFEGMSPGLRETNKGKGIAQFIKLYVNPQVGDKYVDIELNNEKGEPVRLSNNKSKYTLIEFWASWCGSCKAAHSTLVKDYERFKDRGFEVYAVSIDDNKKSWIKTIKNDGLPWINVSDLKGKNSDAAFIYGVFGIPDNFLIDENGTIIGRKLRGEGLTKKLEELFGENLLAASESGS